jgi:hypothetical protein
VWLDVAVLVPLLVGRRRLAKTRSICTPGRRSVLAPVFWSARRTLLVIGIGCLSNPGDRLRVWLHDTSAGFRVNITDLTTHKHGSMTAPQARPSRVDWTMTTRIA